MEVRGIRPGHMEDIEYHLRKLKLTLREVLLRFDEKTGDYYAQRRDKEGVDIIRFLASNSIQIPAKREKKPNRYVTFYAPAAEFEFIESAIARSGMSRAKFCLAAVRALSQAVLNESEVSPDED